MKLEFIAADIFNNWVAKGIPNWDVIALADECVQFAQAKAAPFNIELQQLETRLHNVEQDRAAVIENVKRLNLQVTKLREALANAANVIHSEFCNQKHHVFCVEAVAALEPRDCPVHANRATP